MSFNLVPVAEADVVSLVKSIDKVILNPIIIFLFAVAMVYFLYGVAQYLLSPDNEEIRKKSKSHMIWGVVGLFIMVAVFGIMRLLLNTFGETKIQVNSNGDFNVSSTPLPDKTIADSVKSGKDLFPSGSSDISTSLDAPDLAINYYTTSPFATYEAKPAVCWNNGNKPFTNKSSTEYNALELVKANARDKYLADNHILATDKTKANYPTTYQLKVLYDKNTKAYYAWLDARAPIGAGKDSDCVLKVVTPAKVFPAGSVVFSQSDVSSITGSPDLPLDTYITSPFATYEAKPAVCWNNGNKPFYASGSTEFTAQNIVNTAARNKYLSDNGVSASDEKKAMYPITYQSKVLYNKNNKTYYAWLDARAPVGAGKVSDCNLKVLTEARALPDSIIFSQVAATNGDMNLSTTTLNNYITDFTKSPFLQQYIPNKFCWRKEISANSPTEYNALSLLKIKARTMYISENNLNENTAPQNYPIAYGAFTSYDKISKNYYVWWDARAPIKGGKVTDCNLVATGPAVTLGEPTARSAKPNPFRTQYVSDDNYYRVVDSGADVNYNIARSIAITNALTQIAQMKGLNSITDIPVKVMLEEKYYPQDIYTLNFDYWVAIQVPK